MCKLNRLLAITALLVSIVNCGLLCSAYQQIKLDQQSTDSSLEELFAVTNTQYDLIKELSVRCETNRCKCKDIKPNTIAINKVADRKGLIVIHKMPGCPPCERWLLREKPKAEKAGWEVRTEEYGGKYNSYPQFRVYADPKKPGVWSRGFQTFEQLRGLVK